MNAKASANRNVALLLLGTVALAVGLLVALWLKPAPVALRSGTLLPQPRVLPELGLRDDQGQPYPLARFQGHWTVVFAGFTSCPDICPTTMGLLKQVLATVDPQGERLKVAMLTVDPARDTPEVLGHYVHYFNPNFVGLSTDEPQLTQAARALGIVYARVDDAKSGTYTMDHSAALILIDPQAHLAGYITPPLSPDALAADFRQLLGP